MKGIYYIKHVDSGRIYIGSSKDIKRRLQEHRRLLNADPNSSRLHTNVLLRNYWNKYGESAFEFGVIEELDSDATTEDLRKAEQRHIDSVKSDKDLFNLTRNTMSPLDDPNVRIRCDAIVKHYFSIPKNKESHSQKLKALWTNESYRTKTLEGLRKTYKSEERNRSISESIKNNPERIRRLSEQAKMNWKSQTFRQKVIEASTKASSKPVVCLTTRETFPSATEAARSVGLNEHSVICAIHRKGSCGGLFWDYLNEPVGVEIHDIEPTIKRVVRLDTGEVFESARSASLSLGLSGTAVATSIVRGTMCCNTRWDFVDYPVGNSNSTPKGTKCKPVVRLDSGEVFPSAREASLAFSSNKSAVAGAIHRAVKFDGSYWKYLDIPKQP